MAMIFFGQGRHPALVTSVAPISSKLGAPTLNNNVAVVLLAIPCFEEETHIVLIYTFAP